MRRLVSLLFLSALAIPLLNGCGNGNSATNTCTGANCPAVLTPVSLSMTDTPPSGVSVLSFQVTLSAATLNLPLTGSPVNLLPKEGGPIGSSAPITVDLTQLQAVSQFLSAIMAQPGGYSSVSLTFAHPQLVIYNASDSAISGACAIGSICQIAPPIDGSSTVTLTSGPVHNNIASNAPLSLLIDFHLDTVLQSDFSLNLGTTNGVTVSQILASPSPQYGTLTGTVAGVSSNSVQGVTQFTLQTPDNRTYTIDSSSSTGYSNFPSSACTTGSIACLAQGQIIHINVSGLGALNPPDIKASQVDHVQGPSRQTVTGTILNFIPSTTNIAGAPPSQISLLIRDNPTQNPNLLPGTVATVTFSSGNPTYSIESDGFTLPTGLSFSNGSDFLVGQNVRMNIASGSLGTISGPQPSNTWSAPPTVTFQADGVTLEPSNLTATISALNSSAQSLTLSGSAGPIFLPWPSGAPASTSFSILTTSQTSYRGANPDSLSGFANGNLVSVSGWLFPPTVNGTAPRLAAQSMVLRSNGVF